MCNRIRIIHPIVTLTTKHHLNQSSNMTRYLPAILLAIASLQATIANPLNVREDVPEVIPGEGLPSLAELNVTSAELYAEPLPKIRTCHSDQL